MCFGRLGERKLTRISYLAAAIVENPHLIEQLFAHTKIDYEQPWFLDLLEKTKEVLLRTTLQEAVKEMVADPDIETQTVGRLFLAVIESAEAVKVRR